MSPAYHVRFPGQADATPLRGREIGPAASFPAVTTNQGTAASLAAAERLLIETAARIRACEQRQVPPHDHDLADKDSLLLVIGNACALAGSDVLRHLEPQVAAWTDVITQPWHPVHVTSATELAALDPAAGRQGALQGAGRAGLLEQLVAGGVVRPAALPGPSAPACLRPAAATRLAAVMPPRAGRQRAVTGLPDLWSSAR